MSDSEIDLAFADGLTAAEVYARVKDPFLESTVDLRTIGGQVANRAAAQVDRHSLISSVPLRVDRSG